MEKYALITGASQGIGYEFAVKLAEMKYNLILVARNGEKLAQIQQNLSTKYNIKVQYSAQDLSKSSACEDMFNLFKDYQIEILINNAGFGDFGDFVESDWKKQNEMMQLNMVSLTHITHLFLPKMVAQKSGKIMNVASTASFQPGPLMAVYYATKAYVLSFSEAIGKELEGTGISVTALCPGPTESGFQASASLEESKLVKGKKMPTSQEVAIFGIDALMKNKSVAIHGFQNWFLAGLVKFLPRKMVLNLVKKAQEKAN